MRKTALYTWRATVRVLLGCAHYTRHAVVEVLVECALGPVFYYDGTYLCGVFAISNYYYKRTD